jgi:hypothetical protein
MMPLIKAIALLKIQDSQSAAAMIHAAAENAGQLNVC